MQYQATGPAGAVEASQEGATGLRRDRLRDVALRNALRKREAGVPSYTVPEAAALLSVSQEHLYRLIRGDAFPTVRMRVESEQGRYIIPAQAVEQLLQVAAEAGHCTDVEEWTQTWRSSGKGVA